MVVFVYVTVDVVAVVVVFSVDVGVECIVVELEIVDHVAVVVFDCSCCRCY